MRKEIPLLRGGTSQLGGEISVKLPGALTRFIKNHGTTPLSC